MRKVLTNGSLLSQRTEAIKIGILYKEAIELYGEVYYILCSITKTGGQGRIGRWFSSVANRQASAENWLETIFESCPDVLELWGWGSAIVSPQKMHTHFNS